MLNRPALPVLARRQLTLRHFLSTQLPIVLFIPINSHGLQRTMRTHDPSLQLWKRFKDTVLEVICFGQKLSFSRPQRIHWGQGESAICFDFMQPSRKYRRELILRSFAWPKMVKSPKNVIVCVPQLTFKITLFSPTWSPTKVLDCSSCNQLEEQVVV